MAEIYGPKQRADADGKPMGRWHYTVSSDEERWTTPIGWCAAPHLDPAQECPPAGHGSPEEAIACYRRFVLANELRRSWNEQEQRRCVECGEWTQNVIVAGTFRRWPACVEHDARAVAERHWESKA